MPADKRADFFLSRRGSVDPIAREVADVLTECGYKVIVQDYDFAFGGDFIEAMHEALRNARDLIVLFTCDYESSPYTRKEFTSFEANRLRSGEERRLIILRCEDVPPLGLFAGNVYQDLVGINDPEERKRRIIAAAEGQSLAQRPPPRPFVGAPPRIASFTGRTRELDRLDEILIGGNKPAAITQVTIGRVAVQGMGGVGKTSLAVEYAYRYRDLYAGVWWCPAESRVGLLASLASLAVQLGAAAEESELEFAATAGLRRLAEQRATWLLVYDNVTSPDEIADLLPTAGARVLITSRFSDWSEWAEEVALDVLPRDESVAFIEFRAGRQDSRGAETLAEALGRLPLALDHAAAYCRRTHIGFADYAGKVASLIADAPRGAAYPRSVAATFGLAIAAAAARCPAAELVMTYLAQCAPERVPLTLIEGAFDDESERRAALLALTEVSLIKFDPFEDGTSAVTTHRLVQAVAQSKASASDTAMAARRLRAQLRTIYPKDVVFEPAGLTMCEQLNPHLLVQGDVQPADDAEPSEIGKLLYQSGSYFTARGIYARARQFFERALAMHEKSLDSNPTDTADVLSMMGFLCWRQGDFAGLLNLGKRALAIRERSCGPDHPDTANSLTSIGNAYLDLNDLRAARPYIERSLTIREKVFGPDHPTTSQSIHNLACLRGFEGDFHGARMLFERVLAIREKSLRSDHPYIGVTLYDFAELLRDHGDLDEARALSQRALAFRERVFGLNHPETSRSLNQLAMLHHHQGDLAAAQLTYERALAIYDKRLVSECAESARIRTNYARLLLTTGRVSEALATAQAALAVYEEGDGLSHPWAKESARVAIDALVVLHREGEAAELRARCNMASSD